MHTTDPERRLLTRRDFGKLALAGVPASLVLANLPLSARAAMIDSRIKGVQIGAITYSFNSIAANPNDIIQAYVTIGLGEMELMSNHCEALAGAPAAPARGGGFGRRGAGRGPGGPAAGGAAMPAPGGAARAGQAPAAGRRGGGRGRQMTPEQQAAMDAYNAEMKKWRMSATEATFTPVRDKITNAGILLQLLCYNMNVATTTDDEIEYAFMMAKALGVKAMSTSTQVSMAKRLAPFAEKHQLVVGFHGHDNTSDPEEVSTEATFQEVLAAGKYIGANLDIGHYTAAGGDPVAFIRKYHDRITNLHLKDRKKDHGPNQVWGQGDTPIKPVLDLLVQEKWDIPANIEYEGINDPDGAVAGITKCFQFIKNALA